MCLGTWQPTCSSVRIAASAAMETSRPAQPRGALAWGPGLHPHRRLRHWRARRHTRKSVSYSERPTRGSKETRGDRGTRGESGCHAEHGRGRRAAEYEVALVESLLRQAAGSRVTSHPRSKNNRCEFLRALYTLYACPAPCPEGARSTRIR